MFVSRISLCQRLSGLFRSGPAAGLWFTGEALFLKFMLVINVFKKGRPRGGDVSVVKHLLTIVKPWVSLQSLSHICTKEKG